MTTLVDWQIQRLADLNKGIQPFHKRQLNPASYNLRIGNKGIIETPDGRTEVDLRDGHTVEPGGWILTDVLETIRVPPNMIGQVILRSSAARRGWDHALAGFVDPGYYGILTLEFVNCLKYESLTIKTGMEMVQLKFDRLSTIPVKDYSATGRYNLAKQVEGCKDRTLL